MVVGATPDGQPWAPPLGVSLPAARALLLHLLGYHPATPRTSPEPVRPRQEGPAAQTWESDGLAEVGWGAGNRPPPRGPRPGPLPHPSPDAILVAQHLRRPQLGVQVVVTPSTWRRATQCRRGAGARTAAPARPAGRFRISPSTLGSASCPGQGLRRRRGAAVRARPWAGALCMWGPGW